MDISQISTQLSPSPRNFPGCCLAISHTLTTYLSSLLPQKPAFTLSIGSGSGLLEALISHNHPNTQVEGVEVNSSVNAYIAEQDINVVNGTWDLHPRAGLAQAWMFVYPREPGLVKRYIEMYGGAVDMIVWLGPRADWEDYEPCFRGEGFGDVSVGGDEVGLAGYEMLAVVRRAA
ncbi:hypothetical protein ASPWEDRAFT_118965 [Aspergillus wentii DTO 134E9]|uniref:Uncharacterized protein n=1 Tax=Aspergillus wentii DTO 134E9 TaxID=1073089 RepID=A0A1L9R7H3_ASPWE|nr:uncharacterized protein ASPWEDRAFT_118965 [Aspergillus wentii DTO 134E9]KAI9927495.1 hypothetical protein MW887_003111 [Aspergillus wentii]OJJ30870.1 hypothetical protein ASPWEDRAFT_118965 [Aspergillus wentii DTO 134E9]